MILDKNPIYDTQVWESKLTQVPILVHVSILKKKIIEPTSKIISDNLSKIKLKVTLIELKICLINNTYLLPTFETFNISLVELHPCSFNSIQFGTLLA